MNPEWVPLIKNEKWEVIKKDGQEKILIYGEEFKVNHPCSIHLKLYRTQNNPEVKYLHLKKAHDYMWPDSIKSWHYWSERRFREHCEPWNYIAWAAGASTAKSFDAAKLGLLFWFANPEKRGLIIASTTLESMEARVWGYVTMLLKKMKVNFPFQYYGGKPPKVLYPAQKTNGTNKLKDTLHGIFAVAARQGEDDSAISTWIGRHPEDALMVILDECSDLNLGITKSFANLNASEKPYQLLGIANSNSTLDLHGILSTPEIGWPKIDPNVDTKWTTTQKNGVALYFNPMESPAIHETNPEKKKILSRFLPTEKTIEEGKKQFGESSDSYWRFVLGFWKSTSTESTIVNKELLSQKQVYGRPEWLGIEPLRTIAGLDSAFSTGGDQCVLRLGVLGQTTTGGIVLDFKGEKLLYRIPISARSSDGAEIQIAKQVVEILGMHGVPVHDLCVDATGSGRALSGTIMLQAKAERPPIKVLTVRQGVANVNSFDVLIKTAYDLWMQLREFVEHGQIKGLDGTTAAQLSSRLIVRNEKTGKVQLEPKNLYKKRMAAILPLLAHSPDEADAAVLCLQSAITNYGFSLGQTREIKIKDGSADKYFLWKQGQRMMQEEHMKEQEPKIPVPGFSTSVEDWIGTRKGF